MRLVARAKRAADTEYESRETYITASFKNDAQVQHQIFDIFFEEIDPIKDIAGAIPALIMQPISKDTISRFSRNGGNALGLADAEGPLMREFRNHPFCRLTTHRLLIPFLSSCQSGFHVVQRSR